MMPHEPTVDVKLRTLKNLKFIESYAGTTCPFEVTQLVNSFLGALAHSWGNLRDDLNPDSPRTALGRLKTGVN